jgi:penicillin amidase
MSRWRWDAIHSAVFPHQGLDGVGLLRPLLSRSVPHGGDWSTINVGIVSLERPFDQRSVPSFREVIDLSKQDDNRFLDAVGQSGHPLSPHYDDFLPLWRDGRLLEMKTDRAWIEEHARERLTLVRGN